MSVAAKTCQLDVSSGENVPNEHAKSFRVVRCCATPCDQCRSRDKWARGKMWIALRRLVLLSTDCLFFRTTRYSFFLKDRFFNLKVRHSLIMTSYDFDNPGKGSSKNRAKIKNFDTLLGVSRLGMVGGLTRIQDGMRSWSGQRERARERECFIQGQFGTVRERQRVWHVILI